MRLEHLCDVQWQYELLEEIQPSTAADGQIYGEGMATFTGRLSGTAHWSNFPRLRAGFAHPDARGSIEVGDDGLVLFELRGLSSLADGSGIHVMTFMTAHEPHRWLNEVLAVGEGSIDVDRAFLSMRYYACVVDYRPDLATPS